MTMLQPTSSPVTRDATCHLLRLPLELRVQVYRELLIAEGRLLVTHKDKHPAHLSLQSELSSADGTCRQESVSLHPSILLVCKQIHHEALPILYQHQRGFTFWFQGVVPGSQFAYMDQYVAAVCQTPILRLAHHCTLRITCTRPTERNMTCAAEAAEVLSNSMKRNVRKPKLSLDLRVMLRWHLLPARELRKSLMPFKGLDVASVDLDIQIYSKRHLGGERGFEELKKELVGLFRVASAEQVEVYYPSPPASRLSSPPTTADRLLIE